MTTLVSHAVDDDLPALAPIEDAADRLFVDAYVPEAERPDWYGAPSGHQRASAPGFMLVARELPDGPVVGFVHVLEPAGLAHLEQLSVLPEHGRRGHGRALVEAALSEAAARGHRAITLRTYAEIPFNAPFYRSCGFEVSQPGSPFLRRLVEVERQQGLMRYGTRVQMTAHLPFPDGDSPADQSAARGSTSTATCR
ncbi:GNAT family N-acetyltransferase [Brachybacterium epidermidis]|uniref:GNAT family N-acetyltransferase n=1 Tax=Brachybacterium epidermidis TaxID=2781983 RepID=UPI00398F8DE2